MIFQTNQTTIAEQAVPLHSQAELADVLKSGNGGLSQECFAILTQCASRLQARSESGHCLCLVPLVTGWCHSQEGENRRTI